MPRYFTLEQAEGLLPQVERQLRQAVHLKQEHDSVGAQQEDFHRRVAMSGGMQVDRAKVLAVRSKADATVSRLKEILDEITGLGVQVKDLDKGLLDFPTFYRGDEVLLCFRLGETGIRYWHGLEEGFGGRKEIDDEFVRGHKDHE
jgi:hypothetical protein